MDVEHDQVGCVLPSEVEPHPALDRGEEPHVPTTGVGFPDGLS